MQYSHFSIRFSLPVAPWPGRRLRHLSPWQALAGALIAVLLLTIPADLLAQSEQEGAVIINEIHYNPNLKTEPVEYIELYNPGPATIKLTGWSIAGAVDYRFPDGATLAPDAYLVVAQNAERFKAKYGPTAIGSYTGKLSNEGEEIILRDEKLQRVDVVDYDHHFPWPIVGDHPGHSIQLVNPTLDNSEAGAWRSANPTPKVRNGEVFVTNPPPFVSRVRHDPKSPTSGQPVTVEVEVNDADGIARVLLQYQEVTPGNYISIRDAAYNEQWTNLPMQRVEDGRYQIVLPGSLQKHRSLIRYRVWAEDMQGKSVEVPYADDPQPNFAYFVYDGLPTWSGSANGNPAYAETFDFGQMRPMKTLQLIAHSNEVADALFMPPSPLGAGYGGSDYLWSGTLIYDGDVYDHVGYRARGGFTRYATGKNMWKFNFNRGHRLEASDDYGRKYDVLWDKLNLSAVIQQTHRGYRGEQGMFESTSFRLFNLAGTEAPNTHFVQLRVIDEAEETGATQYEGDFWGLYLAIEQMDGRFLEQHGLPDGNLYRMEPGEVTLANQGAEQYPPFEDLDAFIAAYLPNQEPDWWRMNVDLEKYYGYRSILEAIHHYDVNQGKNFSYFINPETNWWSQHPWDVDLTWADTMPGDGAEPLGRRILRWSVLHLEYQNRMREIRDLLFNREQMDQLIAEYASFINTPADGLAMVDADRAMWDNHPIYGTRYVNDRRTAPGKFYEIADLKGYDRDFAGMLDVMRAWVDTRSQWIDSYILPDESLPYQPTATYVGPAGYPADQLRFESSGFGDPNKDDTFSGLEWRIAEVTDPSAPAYDPEAPIHYEIESTYETPELADQNAVFEPPAGSVLPGHAYRVRVRMKDNTGRWSHWSEPVQFIAGDATAPLADGLSVTEIMYHPAPVPGMDQDRFEFIELQNRGNQPVDLSHMTFDDGVDYQFEPGVTLPPGDFVVLASDRHAFEERYGFLPFDEYDKLLNNDGERIVLRDAYERAVLTLVYNDAEGWPDGVDGDGYSLVLADGDGDPSLPTSWRASTFVHGSPGAGDPVTVVINEVQPSSNGAGQAAIELYNPTDHDADVGHWLLRDTNPDSADLQFRANTVVPAGQYRVFTANDFGGQPVQLLRIPETGGVISLLSAAPDRRLSGYESSAPIGGYAGNIAFGRHVTSDGVAHFVRLTAPTLGLPNSAPYVGPVVISKIMYHPTGGEEYLVLTNTGAQSVQLYDPTNAQRGWRVDELRLQLPGGLELPPGGLLIITAGDAADLCMGQSVAPDVQVIGNLPGPLSDDGMSLTLSAPGAPTASGAIPFTPVDRVTYGTEAPWPTAAAGGGAALERSTLTGFGSEPANWTDSFDGMARSRLANDDPFVRLCTFTATLDEPNDRVAIGWVSAEEANIARFNIWRAPDGDVGGDEVLITPDGVPAQGGQSGAQYQVLDPNRPAAEAARYWLEMVGTNGAVERVGFTMVRNEPALIFLPIVEMGR